MEGFVMFTIVTDSSCNLPDRLIEQYGLSILSLRYMSDSEEHLSYSPDRPTNLTTFYRNMRQGIVYTTSLPYQQPSYDALKALLDAGQDILYIGFSSGISGTYEATESIITELKKDYPNQKALCVNTYAAALGEGLLVLYAAEMQQAGKSIDEVYSWVVTNRFKLAHWFTVDDLMYLYRGGRVSRTSATAANILSIKPVLHVDNEGHLIPKEKVRGRKRSIQALFKHMQATYDSSFVDKEYIAISHGDCLEDAEYLVSLIKGDERFSAAEIIVNELDPVIGAHSGPGTLALFYPATSRN